MMIVKMRVKKLETSTEEEVDDNGEPQRNTRFTIVKSKEKHSLTRKLVGYRNWRQRWRKKEGNNVLGKEK